MAELETCIIISYVMDVTTVYHTHVETLSESTESFLDVIIPCTSLIQSYETKSEMIQSS